MESVLTPAIFEEFQSPLDDRALDRSFRKAQTIKQWSDREVPEQVLRDVYNIFKFGPTAWNCCPARFVWLCSTQGKERLAEFAREGNKAKILAAPVTVIVGHDLDFAEKLPILFPARSAALVEMIEKLPAIERETIAFRNGSLQAAYLIIAARQFGLECGPMSGFDNEGVDGEFFSGTRIKSNFLCSLGYSDGAQPYPRNPRLSFEEAGWTA